MHKSLVKIFAGGIILDSAERISRFFIFFFVVHIFLTRIENNFFLYEEFSHIFGLNIILMVFSVWLSVSFLLNRLLSLGSGEFDTTFKILLKKHTGKSLGFRNCVYVASSLVQFLGVISFAFFLDEYIFIFFLLSSVLLSAAVLFYFPYALNFFYALAIGQSQLIFLILFVSLLLLCEVYGFYSLTLTTALLIVAIRFALLYFARLVILVMLALKRRSLH